LTNASEEIKELHRKQVEKYKKKNTEEGKSESKQLQNKQPLVNSSDEAKALHLRQVEAYKSNQSPNTYKIRDNKRLKNSFSKWFSSQPNRNHESELIYNDNLRKFDQKRKISKDQLNLPSKKNNRKKRHPLAVMGIGCLTFIGGFVLLMFLLALIGVILGGGHNAKQTQPVQKQAVNSKTKSEAVTNNQQGKVSAPKKDLTGLDLVNQEFKDAISSAPDNRISLDKEDKLLANVLRQDEFRGYEAGGIIATYNWGTYKEKRVTFTRTSDGNFQSFLVVTRYDDKGVYGVILQ
jgi:hypothetical protein